LIPRERERRGKVAEFKRVEESDVDDVAESGSMLVGELDRDFDRGWLSGEVDSHGSFLRKWWGRSRGMVYLQ
jgi:hypothetical protein